MTPTGSQSTEVFDARNLGSHGRSAGLAERALVSPILGLFPPYGDFAGESAPGAAIFGRDGLRDSQIVMRLRSYEQAPESPRKSRRDNALFQSVGIAYGKLPAMARMAPVEKDIEDGIFRNCATTGCERSAAQLTALVRKEKPRGFTRLMTAVNEGVNRLVKYQPDRASYGQMDFWANPSTTLNRGAGDCEDYAILKMALLAKAGVPRSSMSIVVLRDQRRNVYHAVLSIRTTQGNFILDNVREQVLADTELPDYLPLYSLSEGRGHIYGRPVGASRMVASFDSLDGIAPGEGQDAEYPAIGNIDPSETPLSVGPR
ncbi:MAG: transglutaminase-like cysteine peptidase [Rhizobiaceae bacterium]